jgi:hypothetical protein
VCAPGQQYSATQRAAAMGVNGAKLFCVGFGSSLVGTACTNAILLVHAALEPAAAADAAALVTPQLPLIQSRCAAVHRAMWMLRIVT